MIHRSLTALLQRFNRSDTGLLQNFFRMGSHGPMQTPMRCFYRSKDNPLNELSNDL